MKSLRVFIVHNRYGSGAPSGENVAVDLEIEILKEAGIAVGAFITSSDMWRDSGVVGQVGAAISSVWNPAMIHRARAAANAFKPDVIHVHNSFPTFSSFLFRSLKSVAPVALTLHNFRLFCAAGAPMRNGAPCLLCLEKKSVLPALRYACYKNSRAKTVPIATGIAIHRARRTWARDVSAFICFTNYHRDLFALAGLPADRIFVKPNCALGVGSVLDYRERTNSAVFIGRLSVEKGIESLVRAWLALGQGEMDLRIVGDGPARAQMEQLCRSVGADITFLGQLDHVAAIGELQRARVVLVPSGTVEGYPMVLAEASAAGTPAIVSNVGPLPGIVGNGGFGVPINFDDSRHLQLELSKLDDVEHWTWCQKNALRYFQAEICASATLSNLLNIYSSIQARA